MAVASQIRWIKDVRAGKIDVIVVYKVDRLTRSLADFAKLVELFDLHNVSFVSVTQQFNTTTSMGRLTLNVLLSFAQFEREVTLMVASPEALPIGQPSSDCRTL
jgi:site-specific DNA recombinase